MERSVVVEPWAPEYGAPLHDDSLAATATDVVIDVEVPADRWAPRPPAAPPGRRAPPEPVVFVDGVRRVDARVWVTDERGTHHGICATYAAGAVRCDVAAGEAVVLRASVRRRLFCSAPGAPALDTAHGSYTASAVVGDDPDQLVLALQRAMADLEHRVSVAVKEATNGELVMVDGPLRDRHRAPDLVGYVKTHQRRYLPDAVRATVDRLAAGERTPVFQIGGPWPRWSWYLRLPGPGGHPWAGVVRAEVANEVPVDDAVRLADRVTAALPRFASEPQKDPRAPQNLHPIAGLERGLRRRLGDPHLLLRALRESTIVNHSRGSGRGWPPSR